jgi:hypothetical protein
MNLPHFGHKNGGNGSILTFMKNMVITCVGLVCLSALGGYVLFASHTAFAAGPKLPMTLMRAHAVTADESAKVMPAALSGQANAETPGAVSLSRTVATASQTRSQPSETYDDVAVSHQERDDALAPFRALRPVARPQQPTAVVAQDTRDVGLIQGQTLQPSVAEPDEVVSTVRRTAPVQTAPLVIRPTSSTSVLAQRGTTSSPEPGYWFGVFR